MSDGKAVRTIRKMGFVIEVETDEGQKRHWYDPVAGESGYTEMKYPYGYIKGTLGVDGDSVDVFVGPSDSDKVFIITQLEKPNFKNIDEQKVMLGFRNSIDAKSAYLDHYDSSRFFGDIKEMSLNEFKFKVRNSKGTLIKSKYYSLIKEINSGKLGGIMLYLNKSNGGYTPIQSKKNSEVGSKVWSSGDKSDKSSIDEDEMDLKKDSSINKKFQSEAQRRYMYAAKDRGEISENVVEEFEEKTPKGSNLPKKVKNEKSVTKALQDTQDIFKALKSSIVARLVNRDKLINYKEENSSDYTPLKAEPVTVWGQKTDIGIEKSRPFYEPPIVPVRYVSTPFEIPPKICKDHEYSSPEYINEEAKPFWRR